MRPVLAVVAALTLLASAGCGGGDRARRPAPSASATVAPPDSQTLKRDLRTAAIQLEAYKLAERAYTDDERLMGEAFPRTVTIKDADATSFYMAARDEGGVRYTLRKDAERTRRACAPPRAGACPEGAW